MDNKDLLAVLDMSEAEQVKFLYINGHRQVLKTFSPGRLNVKYGENHEIIDIWNSQGELSFDLPALADLAFRLTIQTTINTRYLEACKLIYKKVFHTGIFTQRDMWLWFATRAPSIAKIIAALIAKGNTNG